MATIRFLGAEELRDKFVAMTEAARIQVLEQSVPAAADIPLQRIAAAAPVGTDLGGYWNQPAHTKAHHLKDDLTLETLERNQDRMVVGVKFGADSFYWHFIEFGTKHAPAHPFIRQAFSASKTQIAGEIRDGMRDSLLGFTE
jgi:HK97 gp10 family phage protein